MDKSRISSCELSMLIRESVATKEANRELLTRELIMIHEFKNTPLTILYIF